MKYRGDDLDRSPSLINLSSFAIKRGTLVGTHAGAHAAFISPASSLRARVNLRIAGRCAVRVRVKFQARKYPPASFLERSAESGLPRHAAAAEASHTR